MAKAKNKVIAGDYQGWECASGGIFKSIWKMNKDKVYFNKDTILSYEIITQENAKSLSSAITRGAIGSALLGPIGIAAAVTAKNNGIYSILINWKDEKTSLIEIDTCFYKGFVYHMKQEGIPCEN